MCFFNTNERKKYLLFTLPLKKKCYKKKLLKQQKQCMQLRLTNKHNKNKSKIKIKTKTTKDKKKE